MIPKRYLLVFSVKGTPIINSQCDNWHFDFKQQSIQNSLHAKLYNVLYGYKNDREIAK